MYKILLPVIAVSLVLSSQARSAEGVQALYSFPYDAPTQMVRGSDGNFYGYVDWDAADALAQFLGEDVQARQRVFQLTQTGVYRVIHYFESVYDPQGTPGPDNMPVGPLLAAPDGSLYGAVSTGGTNGYGALFRLTPDGTYEDIFENTATESIKPFALSPSGDIFGLNVDPTLQRAAYVCKLSAAGEFSVLHSFPASTAQQASGSFSDAASAALPRVPFSIFLASDGNLYGATRFGGEVWKGSREVYSSAGILFQLAPDGAFTELETGPFANYNGKYQTLSEAADGTLYGWGATLATAESGGGDPTEIFSYTSGAGYQRVRLFNQLMGEMEMWLPGSDGNSYCAVRFPFSTAYGDYGAYGGTNITMVDPSGNQTVLASFPNQLIDDQGDVRQTVVEWMLDGHDGFIYLIVAENQPIFSGPTLPVSVTAGTSTAAVARPRFVTRRHFTRVRSVATPQDRLAAMTDRVQLPRPRAGAPAAVTINVLRNDVITSGSKPAIVSVSTPAHGTAGILPATAKTRAMIRYTAAESAAQDTFTYEVTDASGASVTGKVVVYAAPRGRFRGAISSEAAGTTRLGIASLLTGSLGSFTGNLSFNGKSFHIPPARFDANNSWRHTFSRNALPVADVTLVQQPDGSITGTVTGSTATGQFAAEPLK